MRPFHYLRNLYIRLWIWLTPEFAKEQIVSTWMRNQVKLPPKFANLTQPLVRRVFPSQIAGELFPIQKMGD